MKQNSSDFTIHVIHPVICITHVNTELVNFGQHTGCPRRKVSILGGHSIGYSKQKVYMCMCPIPNCFWDRAISLYSSKILDKKEILHTVSNMDNYCSSDYRQGMDWILDLLTT
jgi:hypothetical protein